MFCLPPSEESVECGCHAEKESTTRDLENIVDLLQIYSKGSVM